jgi:hypothetical protein
MSGILSGNKNTGNGPHAGSLVQEVLSQAKQDRLANRPLQKYACDNELSLNDTQGLMLIERIQQQLNVRSSSERPVHFQPQADVRDDHLAAEDVGAQHQNGNGDVPHAMITECGAVDHAVDHAVSNSRHPRTFEPACTSGPSVMATPPSSQSGLRVLSLGRRYSLLEPRLCESDSSANDVQTEAESEVSRRCTYSIG